MKTSLKELTDYIEQLETENEILENKLKGYEEEFNELRNKIKDILDGVEY